jgi:stage II sporulation protein D
MTIAAPGLRASRAAVRVRPADPERGTVLSVRSGWGRRGVYAGVLDVALAPQGLRVVQQANLEAYVEGVVAAEMPNTFPLEAMKAQAVAARTYALQHLGGHGADDADLCARVHCQAYAGTQTRASTAAQAARETAGWVLSWNGILVDALYHSACGGATAPAWEVRQGKLLPYLAGGADTPQGGDRTLAYCSREHDMSWSKRLSHAEAERLVCANLGVVARRPDLSPRRLSGMLLTRAESTGRAQWLKVYTDRGAYGVRGDAVRWLFGTGRPGRRGLRSTAFDITLERRSGSAPSAYVFEGVGHGHGIGLCQWGCRGRAAAGQKAEEILAAYYPGAIIAHLRDERQ